MAVSVPASPFSVSFFNSEPEQSKLFPDDSGSIGLYTTFGEDDSNTSFGSWPDPYSCSEVSSFPSADDSFSSLLNSPAAAALPSEDDLNLAVGASASELLEHYGCHPNTPVMMHSNFVETPKDLMTSDELYIAEENQFAPEDHVAEMHHYAPDSQLSDTDSPSGSFEGGTTHVELPGDCFQVSNDEDSVEEEPTEEPVDGVHIPPPLNMKRIEMFDDAYYESIEAAEVPLDVIENKRPFQCGLAGCDKTFKNPQTMKMHHKTHFSDGSAELDALPTLTTPGNGSGSAASWMAGRSKKIPSRCPKCRKTFVGLYELRRHYGRKHSEGERPFQCRKCDKRFYIEVDVRDHEKLCGEQIECKCGLKFAFKCNMVAHKKAHPACQDPVQPNNSTSVTIINSTNNNSTSVSIMNSTSVTIMNSTSNNSSINSGYQSTISDEDSSRSRWISSGGAPRRPHGTKRCHELVEESRPDLMSKLMKVYSRRSSPAQNFPGLGPQEDATCAGFDFTGLGDGSSLWSSANLHYSNVPWTVPRPVLSTSVFGSLDQFPRRGETGKLSSLDLLQLAGVTPGL